MANAHIVNFIQSLNDDEIKTAENHIRKVLSACKTNSIESKQLVLFKYITSNRNKYISESNLIKITNSKNIQSLKLGLYETITESLIYNKNIKNSFCERDQVLFRLKKKLLIARILSQSLNQKRHVTLQHIVNEITKEAKQYELYEVLIEVLTLKKYYSGIRMGISQFDSANKEIAFYEYCLKAAYHAGDCYYRLVIHNDLIQSFSQKELDQYFQLSIEQMENDYKKTKSKNIAYYLNIIKFALYEQKKDYTKAHEYCKKHLNMLRGQKAIYRKDRIASVFNNLSLFKTHLGDYTIAAINAKKAQKYNIKGSFNHTISKVQEMYPYIYSNNKKEALRCTEDILEHATADIGKFRRSKFIYYRSCALFISENYKAAFDLLKKPLEIEKDKTRWNISLRIFKIMLYVELKRVDEAEIALEALRKFMERITKKEEVSPRNILIVKLLREIEKTNFTYSPKNMVAKKMLKELSEKNKPTSWEHYTSELIPFHKWLEGKIK